MKTPLSNESIHLLLHISPHSSEYTGPCNVKCRCWRLSVGWREACTDRTRFARPPGCGCCAGSAFCTDFGGGNSEANASARKARKINTMRAIGPDAPGCGCC